MLLLSLNERRNSSRTIVKTMRAYLMQDHELEKELAFSGLEIGKAVRRRIYSIPKYRRGDVRASSMAMKAQDTSRAVDAEAEEICLSSLKKLSAKLSRRFRIILDPAADKVFEIGHHKDSEVIYAYLDPVDGSMKVAGLGNEPEKGIYRIGNNGCWGIGIAFTLPTSKQLSDLKIGDFQIAAIVDGNPTLYRTYPTNAVVYPVSGPRLQTYECDESKRRHKLCTSSQKELSQATVLFDAFQAFDTKSAKSGSQQLVVRIFEKLINRNEGGAFDIVRLYANIGETLRQLLERDGKRYRYEPQSVGSITVNENLPNLLPITSIIEGAGGQVVDFEGNPISGRALKSERPNVIVAANLVIRDKLLNIVRDA